MSFEKALAHGKKKKRPHYKSKKAEYGFPRCDCSWCVSNRLHSTNVQKLKNKEILISHDVIKG